MLQYGTRVTAPAMPPSPVSAPAPAAATHTATAPVVVPEVPAALADLFRRTEAALKPTILGPTDQWYLVAIACIAAGPDSHAAAHLYAYLIQQPQYATSAERQALVRRLREALIKAVSLVGVCKPLGAILAISAVEQPEDRDYSETRAGWQCDDANLARAMEWYGKVYKQNSADTLSLFDAHKDFIWVSKHITYGLYLGDRQVLNDLDTEMIVFPAIMSQNLRMETWWHIRGTRRIGVSNADTKVLYDVVKDINAHFGVTLDKVPTVDEVEHDV
ncbi:hypothetical protein SEPCBS119000_006213 [Sporothrix epigloea]|uniref:Carboxymuconolactone decarboxylase-like domain-containing protein n=1 Tax=Sporothrix epigloea TaxID=1892477 RepID=A0ABP0E258_9PEZI